MIPVIYIFDLSEILLAFIFIYYNLQQFCRISLRYLNRRKHWMARNHIYFHIKIRTHLPRRHQWNINAVPRLNILWNQDGTARQGLEMIVLLVLSLSIHYGDVIMGRWRLKSPASRLFIQPFIQTQIKENTIAPRHWPLCGEFTGDRWIPRAKGQ